MKTLCLAIALSTAALSSGIAQVSTSAVIEQTNRPVVGASARDGFTLRGPEMVITRNGVTSKVDREFKFSSGLRVSASGSITLPGGGSAALRPNQLLAFDGSIQDVVLTPDGVAPLSSVDTGASPKPAVAPTSRDGIRMTGTEVFLTRNGYTEKVTADVRLPNGVTVSPAGKVTLGTGNTIVLKADQMLKLDGELQDAPLRR